MSALRQSEFGASTQPVKQYSAQARSVMPVWVAMTVFGWFSGKVDTTLPILAYGPEPPVHWLPASAAPRRVSSGPSCCAQLGRHVLDGS